MFGILLNNTDVSNLLSIIHNAAVNISGITNLFCISDGFLQIHLCSVIIYSVKKDMSLFKGLEDNTKLLSRKVALILHLHMRYVRGTFHCPPDR